MKVNLEELKKVVSKDDVQTIKNLAARETGVEINGGGLIDSCLDVAIRVAYKAGLDQRLGTPRKVGVWTRCYYDNYYGPNDCPGPKCKVK